MIVYDALHREIKSGDLVILPNVTAPVCQVMSVQPDLETGGMLVVVSFLKRTKVPANGTIGDVLVVKSGDAGAGDSST